MANTKRGNRHVSDIILGVLGAHPKFDQWVERGNRIPTGVLPGIGHLSIGGIPDIVYRESIPSLFRMDPR
jgi:hypothetical protein